MPDVAGFFCATIRWISTSESTISKKRGEKRGEKPVVINVDLFVPLALSTPKEDKPGEVVDYDFMRSTVARCVEKGHIHLQETLCDDQPSPMPNPEVPDYRFYDGCYARKWRSIVAELNPP